MASLLILLMGAGAARAASTLCVNPKGNHGCLATIQAAIDSVTTPHTTIVVEPGTYTASCSGPACSVATIARSTLTGLTLQCGRGARDRGEDSRDTSHGHSVILDASNLDHAVYISGVNQVTIEGCVAENAAREGILVENSDNVHIANNEVRNNDEAMAATVGKGPPPCPTFVPRGGSTIRCCPDAFPGGPGNFPDDNDDCGEGLHLRSVTHSVVEGNDVHDNVGGILLTDETGPSSDNLIANNTSQDNLKFGGDRHRCVGRQPVDRRRCLSERPDRPRGDRCRERGLGDGRGDG